MSTRVRLIQASAGKHELNLIWPVILLVLAPSFASRADQGDEAVRAIEKQMAERPLEALAVARQAADAGTVSPGAQRKLFETAARILEKHLSTLSEDQVVELASVRSKTLGDPESAKLLQRRWLKLRQEALGPADGLGRLHLAILTFRWLGDRHRAAQLCQEALRAAPELAAATQVLKGDLNYSLTDSGWAPREKTTDANDSQRIRLGMTAAEVRKRLGQPSRVARQVLYRRYREQWFYDNLAGLRIDFDCIKGQDPHVLTVHSASRAPP